MIDFRHAKESGSVAKPDETEAAGARPVEKGKDAAPSASKAQEAVPPAGKAQDAGPSAGEGKDAAPSKVGTNPAPQPAAGVSPEKPQISPTLNPEPPPRRTGNYRILVDPGHGGEDPGARRTGIKEKEIVLDVARRVVQGDQRHPRFRGEVEPR